MKKLCLTGLLWGFCLLVCWRTPAQQVYYNASSAIQGANSLDTVTNGINDLLLSATGVDGNKITRCTALAVDPLNGKLFFLDGQTRVLWSANLDGTGLSRILIGLFGYPTDLALDVLNEQIYYTTSSTVQGSNTVQVVSYGGTNNQVLFTATGPAPGNGVSRCTAIAVDRMHSLIFIADAGTKKIWSMSLAGTGLAMVASAADGYPIDVALDVTNQQVYFTLSSTVQSANQIQRVNYNGTGLTTVFTASGSVGNCTALDLDLADANIYFSDAGAETLWRISLAGGSATKVLGNLAATAKKVRWFSGPEYRPAPIFTGISVAGANATLNATNGFIGGTYYVLTTTNLTTPISQWLTISTNVLSGSGNFTLTVPDGSVSNVPQQFYTLLVQ